MILRLERRSQRSTLMAFLSPVLAIAATLALGAVMFVALGFDPGEALYIYFIEPLTSVWSIEEVIVKAAPLILIGVGLAVCYTANVWNIGAEGQLTMGALVGASIPIYFPDWQSPLVLILMLVLGIAGGALFAAIPAFLKNRFSANEILTSLMLVYVAQLAAGLADSRGLARPRRLQLPAVHTVRGLAAHTAARRGTGAYRRALRHRRGGHRRLHDGADPARVRDPRRRHLAARGAFAGFKGKRVVLFCFMLSGALAGLAGICEVAGPSGQLQPHVSPGYGFTAIIVAFVGRLNPIGVLFAGVLLAISYMGGEGVQVELGISDKTTQVFQGMLLFLILACDTLIRYRIRLVRN